MDDESATALRYDNRAQTMGGPWEWRIKVGLLVIGSLAFAVLKVIEYVG